MKKILFSLVAAASIAVTLAADEEKVFIGGNIGGGNGTVKIHSSDSNSNFTFTDSEKISTSDLKVYAGYGQVYGFYQSGTISPDTQYMDDLDYQVIGLGWMRKAEFWKLETSIVNIVPEFDAEIGYDEVTNSNFDGSGLLLSFDFGIGLALADFKNVELTAALGYDIHVVNDSTSSSYDGSWNFGSLQATIGARYNF
jgi:hypothetical protein